METLKFKTTIKCSGCLGKATPYLDALAGEDNWEVDIQSPEKVLTVLAGDVTNAEAVINAVQQAGFKAEVLAS